MVPNTVISSTTGLSSQGNDLSAPPGALAVAENVILNRDNMPEVRRGFQDYSTNLPDFTPKQLLANSAQTQAYANVDGALWYYDATSSKWLAKSGLTGSAMSLTNKIYYESTNGLVYVSGDYAIQEYNMTTGARRVFAGTYGISGSTDGTGVAAKFNIVQEIVGDGSGNLYACDYTNHTIRKIVIATGVVTTFAGAAGVSGTTDATGGSARFNGPIGICRIGANLYVAEKLGNNIRKIVIATGVVTTIKAGVTSNLPSSICTNGTDLFVSDSTQHYIVKVTLAGVVTTLAGNDGVIGYVDGTGTGATFHAPRQIAYDGSGSIYCADDRAIRKIVISSGVVTTPAGNSTGAQIVDGIGSAAYFVGSAGLAFVSSEKLIVADSTSFRRMYISTAYVHTLTGSAAWQELFPTTTPVDSFVLGPDYSTSERRVRLAELNGNTYFTTNAGIKKSTSAASTLTYAGLPRPTDPRTANSAGAGTILANNTARAFRTLFGIRDANNNVLLSSPSQNVKHANTAGAGTKNAVVTQYLTTEITTSHFVQLYATTVVASSLEPGDEMSLIIEYNPTTTDIANGYVTFTDNVPDAFRNADLYTNENQEGQAAQNDRPPLARDVCAFRGRILYANYTERQRMTLQQVGVGFSNADTITIAGTVYTAAAAEVTSTGTFLLYTGGTQSVNVDTTARSLVKCINSYTQNSTVSAYYLSGPEDTPGLIMIEERAIGGSAFVATCSAAGVSTAFSPAVPTSGSTYTSIADRKYAGIRCSKYLEPEAAPLGDVILVGDENDAIERVIPLRDSCIIIKQRSVWRMIDSAPGTQPQLLDNTVSCAGRDSFAVLNNSIFGLSNQGFVGITDNGVQLVGRPEEHKVIAGLDKLSAPDHTTLVGVGVEAQRLYLCAAWDAAANEATIYVFNAIGASRGWSRIRHKARAFTVVGDRVLMALDNAYGHVLRQRASRRDGDPFAYDYSEETSTFTISSIDTTAKTCTGVWTETINYDGFQEGIGEGWLLIDGSNRYFVTASASANTVLTLNTTTSLTTGAKTIVRPIEATVEWQPIVQNPGELKQFNEVILKAEMCDVYSARFTFANETDYRSDPASDDYSSTQPTAIDVKPLTYPSSATTGSVYPWQSIRTTVPPARAGGQQLSVRTRVKTARGRFMWKSLVVSTLQKQSNKARQ